MTGKVTNYGMHGSTGLFILHDQWTKWVLAHQSESGLTHQNNYGLGEVLEHTWQVDGQTISVLNDAWLYAEVLPDASGFIAFEKGWKPDNCLLLDAHGKERMRLTVPRNLTGGLVDPSYETGAGTFCYVSSTPYFNPKTGIQGQFGVEAYVEEGRFYFELNYQTGEFLWGRQIRD